MGLSGGKFIMAIRGPRYSKEEFARRGDELYETKVRPHLKKKDKGRIVAIDIETGEWEIGDNEMEAYDHLVARIPGAHPWLVMAGSRYLHTFGGRGADGGSE
jgi:hypothetical protein